MIMETLYVIAALLIGCCILGYGVLKELQRLRLLIHETVSNTQVMAMSIPQGDFRDLLATMPDIQPWRESDARLDDSTEVN